MPYAWLQYAAARQQLSARLADPQQALWTDAECGLYICEALRMWNVFTNTWKQDFVFTPVSPWVSLATLSASPRAYTVTDIQTYTLLEYHLYEPPTGGTWTGTTQFSMGDLVGALQRCRDEIQAAVNCGQSVTLLPSTPNTRRTMLPDTVLEPQRVRFLATAIPGQPVTPPVTLVRDDRLALEYFRPSYLQATPTLPQAWMVAAEPPLAIDVDVPPGVPGQYELLALQSGGTFANPPAGTLLGLPDDFAWVARWGVLADLLGRESEATDRARAAWCQQHYADGLKLLANTPWVMLASLNGQAVNLSAMTNADRYKPEWDSNPLFTSAAVTAGIDFLWLPSGFSVGLTVLASAPLPVLDTDFLQVSRNAWDAVLSMAQLLATFKLGGEEFQSAAGLEQIFVQAALKENSRLEALGLYSDVLSKRATTEDRVQERYGQS